MKQMHYFFLTRSKTIGCVRQNTALPKFNQKLTEAAFSADFSNFDKDRQEVASDVISSLAVEKVGIDVRVKFGDSRLNSPLDRFLHIFVLHSVAFCSRPEAASDVMSGRFVLLIVHNKCVKFCDPRLQCSGEV